MIKLVMTPCPECPNTDYCLNHLIPLLRCDVCNEEGLERLLKVIRREAHVISRIHDLIFMCNMCFKTLKHFIEAASIIKSMGSDNKICLMVSWDLLESSVLLDRRQYVKSMYRYLDSVYIALLRPEDIVMVSNALRHRPLSTIKNMTTLIVEVLSEDDVRKVVNALLSLDIGTIAVVTESRFHRLIEALLNKEGFKASNTSEVGPYEVHTYEDGRGRGVKVLMPGEGESVVITPVNADERVREVRRMLTMPVSPAQVVIDSLCRAKWYLDVAVFVEGHKVLDRDLLGILEEIDKAGAIRRTLRRLEISYPTIKGRISALEKALGIKVVESRRGGWVRGLTTLSEEGRILLSIYRDVLEELDEYLDNLIAKLCERHSNS